MSVDPTSSPLTLRVSSGSFLDVQGNLCTDEIGGKSLYREVELAATSTTYYLEVQRTETNSDTDDRAIWDPSYDNGAGQLKGKEFVDSVTTRVTYGWEIVTPVSTSGFDITSNPDSARVPLGIVATDGSGALDFAAGHGYAAVLPSTLIVKDEAPGANSVKVGDARVLGIITGDVVSLYQTTASTESRTVSSVNYDTNVITFTSVISSAYTSNVSRIQVTTPIRYALTTAGSKLTTYDLYQGSPRLFDDHSGSSLVVNSKYATPTTGLGEFAKRTTTAIRYNSQLAGVSTVSATGNSATYSLDSFTSLDDVFSLDVKELVLNTNVALTGAGAMNVTVPYIRGVEGQAASLGTTISNSVDRTISVKGSVNKISNLALSGNQLWTVDEASATGAPLVFENCFINTPISVTASRTVIFRNCSIGLTTLPALGYAIFAVHGDATHSLILEECRYAAGSGFGDINRGIYANCPLRINGGVYQSLGCKSIIRLDVSSGVTTTGESSAITGAIIRATNRATASGREPVLNLNGSWNVSIDKCFFEVSGATSAKTTETNAVIAPGGYLTNITNCNFKTEDGVYSIFAGSNSSSVQELRTTNVDNCTFRAQNQADVLVLRSYINTWFNISNSSVLSDSEQTLNFDGAYSINNLVVDLSNNTVNTSYPQVYLRSRESGTSTTGTNLTYPQFPGIVNGLEIIVNSGMTFTGSGENLVQIVTSSSRAPFEISGLTLIVDGADLATFSGRIYLDGGSTTGAWHCKANNIVIRGRSTSLRPIFNNKGLFARRCSLRDVYIRDVGWTTDEFMDFDSCKVDGVSLHCSSPTSASVSNFIRALATEISGVYMPDAYTSGTSMTPLIYLSSSQLRNSRIAWVHAYSGTDGATAVYAATGRCVISGNDIEDADYARNSEALVDVSSSAGYTVCANNVLIANSGNGVSAWLLAVDGTRCTVTDNILRVNNVGYGAFVADLNTMTWGVIMGNVFDANAQNAGPNSYGTNNIGDDTLNNVVG